MTAAPAVHVVGAGLAGLAAAVALARGGRTVALHEAGGRAGGRCASRDDPLLGRALDNGNHLLLSGNRDAMRYLETVGAADLLDGPEEARFPFLDLRTGQRWVLRPNAGRLPWWLLAPRRRVPGTAFADYLPGLRLAAAGPKATVAGCVGGGRLFERLWEPLATAVLNAPPRLGAARLLRAALGETFARGEAACRPRVAGPGLSPTFVDPALGFLRRSGAAIRFGRRLRGIVRADGRAAALDFGTDTVALGKRDGAVLALPPSAAAALMPEIDAPAGSQPIVNVHFRLPGPADLPFGSPFLGLIGGTAQWLFARGDVASVTVSAAGGLSELPAATVAERTWADAASALGRKRIPLPPHRVVKERRATFAQTPGNLRKRPGTRTALANLWLAGDWTDTGLPATIEGAVRSGHRAARIAAGELP